MSVSAVGAIGMPATRVGDDIAHTMARFGLFAGMIAGALLVAATVATGGAALVVVGAAVAAGAAGGGLVGMAVGGMYMGPPTGKLAIGSPNVFINHRPATMTFLGAAACGHHPGPPIPVATGSATVMINNGYAAREGETMGCSAVIIASCSPDVIIGGESVQDPRVEIRPEIPDWVVDTLTVIAIAGAIIATGGAVAAAMAGGASFAGAAGTVALGVGRGLITSTIASGVGSGIGYAVDGQRGAIAGGAIGGFVGLPGRRLLGRGNRDFVGTLRGQPVRLPGVRAQRIQYVKRNPTDTRALRNRFNSSGRGDFLKNLSNTPAKRTLLTRRGFTPAEIAKMQNGRVPNSDFQVHHKLPLDDGGTNDFRNLVLIQNQPYHKVITNSQNALTRGMQPGDVRMLDFPIPGGSIYP